MQNKAIYSGTFDPITFGHIDLVERAVRLFDQVIVAVAHSQSKNTLFSLDKRISLAKSIFSDFPSVEVAGFDGLLLEFAKQKQANILLRGLRVVSDFDYEFQMAYMNQALLPKVETIFLSPAAHFAYVSSSLVREIASMHGDVSKFVPPVVEAALKKKF